jgi:hypothetical protein
MTAARMAVKKREHVEQAPRHEAPTRKVDVLSAAFADHVLSAELEAQRAERLTARDLPDDPESTDERDDREALEAARLIVVDEDARSPSPGDARSLAEAPAPASRTLSAPSRILGLIVALGLAAGLVAWLAAASGR